MRTMTTTIEILEGLLRPTSGEVEVLGLRWGQSDNEIRQRIGKLEKIYDRLNVRDRPAAVAEGFRRGLLS